MTKHLHRATETRNGVRAACARYGRHESHEFAPNDAAVTCGTCRSVIAREQRDRERLAAPATFRPVPDSYGSGFRVVREWWEPRYTGATSIRKRRSFVGMRGYPTKAKAQAVADNLTAKEQQ